MKIKRKTLIRALVVLLMFYVVFLAVTYIVMSQPPETICAFMKRVPPPLRMILLMKPIWSVARAGSLSLGDPAPDFELPTEDGKSMVKLSQFRGKKPVALVFGSYT